MHACCSLRYRPQIDPLEQASDIIINRDGASEGASRPL